MVGGTTFVPNVNPPVVALVNKMRPPPTVTGAAVVDGITIVGGAAGKIYGVGIVVVVVVVSAVVNVPNHTTYTVTYHTLDRLTLDLVTMLLMWMGPFIVAGVAWLV